MFPMHILSYLRTPNRHVPMDSLQSLQEVSQQQRPYEPIDVDEDASFSDKMPLLEDVTPPGTSSSFLRAHDPTSHWLYLPSGLPRIAAAAAASCENICSRSSSRGSIESRTSRRSRKSKASSAG